MCDTFVETEYLRVAETEMTKTVLSSANKSELRVVQTAIRQTANAASKLADASALQETQLALIDSLALQFQVTSSEISGHASEATR